MPTNQPSNAPDALPADAGEDLTVAGVLTDEQMDDTPGGGGLGGAAAADPLGGSARAPGGPAANEADPDAAMADANAVREAQLRSLEQ